MVARRILANSRGAVAIFTTMSIEIVRLGILNREFKGFHPTTLSKR